MSQSEAEEEAPPKRPTRSLKGRVAIVTGAGAAGYGIGNGRAAAILLAEDGCKVVCVDLNLQLAERTVEMIRKDSESESQSQSSDTSSSSGEAIAIQADVTSTADCERIVQTTISHYGRLDILFNCVGTGGAKGTAIDVDMTEWARGLEVNVSSMVNMAKYAIPEMIKNNKKDTQGYNGSIVNMGSVAGIRGGTPHLLYPTSKGAVVNMTRAMAAHHAADGIRVNCICPGMVYTPMMYNPAGGSRMTAEARESRKNRSLLKTEGNGWDVGAAVRFLASDQARWITGLIMPVDAGVTAAVGTDVPKSASVNP